MHNKAKQHTWSTMLRVQPKLYRWHVVEDRHLTPFLFQVPKHDLQVWRIETD